MLYRSEIQDLQYYSLISLVILNSTFLEKNNLSTIDKFLVGTSIGCMSLLTVNNIYNIYYLNKK